MSNYIKATDFSVKDGLTTGDPDKRIKGTEIDDEFDALAIAIATKADLTSPAFLGTPTATTASPGVNNTQLATTAFVTAADTAAVTAERTATATLTNKTLTSPTINGGTITGITDLVVADGGTGRSTLTADNVILGDGTNPVKFVAPGTSGNILTSNGTTWTSAALPAPTTNQVLSATASASLGDIGSYAFMRRISGTTIEGTNYAGSTVRYASIIRDSDENTGDAKWNTQASYGSANPSGTWKALGRNNTNGLSTWTLFLRVA